MIAYLELDLNRIAGNSRDYPWPQPQGCRRCRHPKLWCHGFVRVIFDGFRQALQMRRYRCPKCGCVVRVRPAGFFARHQSAVASIRGALAHRISTGRWLGGVPGNRARHWLGGLKKHALAVWGWAGLSDLIAAFDRLKKLGDDGEKLTFLIQCDSSFLCPAKPESTLQAPSTISSCEESTVPRSSGMTPTVRTFSPD